MTHLPTSTKQTEGRKSGLGGIFLGTIPWLRSSLLSVHNARSLPCLSSLCLSLPLPPFVRWSPASPPLPLLRSGPVAIRSWHSCGRDPLGMAGSPCMQSKIDTEVGRVSVRLGKAGSFPHAHWDLAVYADGHSQACYYWRSALLASSLPGLQPAPTPQAASASCWCQSPLLDSPGNPAPTSLGLGRFLGRSTRFK